MITLGNPDDRNQLLARLELVAIALGVPDHELESATGSDDGLFTFADKHGQSLDWLVLGDVRGMIHRCKRHR